MSSPFPLLLSKRLVLRSQIMKCTALKWRATTEILQGFLAMTFLISGTSALECYRSNAVAYHSSRDTIIPASSPSSSKINCSREENACVEVQIQLNIDETTVIVSHSGCAIKDFQNGSSSVTTGDEHFGFQSNVSYCLKDLCNGEMMKRNISKIPGHDRAPETRGSNQCYSGIAFVPDEAILKSVTCYKGYDQCYSGKSIITAGPLFVNVFIKTCQRPTCDVPQNQSLGPTTFVTQWGNCCIGSNCNGLEDATLNQKTNTSASSNEPYRVNHTTRFSTSDAEGNITSKVPWGQTVSPGLPRALNNSADIPVDQDYDEFDWYNDEILHTSSVPSFPDPRIRIASSQSPMLQFCPLLIALGITVLMIWC